MNYLLYNPMANNGQGERMKDSVLPTLESKYGHFNVMDITVNPTRVFYQSLTSKDLVILIGGDGTVSQFANYVHGAGMPCKTYLYKAGSGNDFLSDVVDDIKDNMVELNKYFACLPRLTVHGRTRYFINGVGYGMDGVVCEITEEYKKNGEYAKVDYRKIAAKLLLTFKPVKAHVEVDGKAYDFDQTWIVATMVGRYYGNGMMVAPDQKRLSHKVTVVIYHDISRLQAIARFPKIFKGELVKYKDMTTVLTGKHVVISFDRPCSLQVEGEAIRDASTITIDIE